MESMESGQQIKHELYGLGIVTESDNERTTVDFQEHGMKKFVTSLMQAELIGEPIERPVRSRRRRKSTK